MMGLLLLLDVCVGKVVYGCYVSVSASRSGSYNPLCF